eukprot:scaffold15193_cov101-Isochrysis_galbana.AAC.1
MVPAQPNVSYICSRYYRAPELMFGATEYGVAIDVWSVGTILVELFLGHLPFQGHDSTQQHLVEIMKLLGTPTDADLQAMNAPCVAEDLPTLKPFPWDRIFAAGTPPEAIDLAQRLLRYNPSQRLDAVATLAHPFFDRAAEIVSGTAPVEMATTPGTGGGQQPDTAAEWEQRINRYYSDIMGREAGVESAVRAIVSRIEYAAGKKTDPSILAAEAVEAMQLELSTEFKGAVGLNRRDAAKRIHDTRAGSRLGLFSAPFPWSAKGEKRSGRIKQHWARY